MKSIQKDETTMKIKNTIKQKKFIYAAIIASILVLFLVLLGSYFLINRSATKPVVNSGSSSTGDSVKTSAKSTENTTKTPVGNDTVSSSTSNNTLVAYIVNKSWTSVSFKVGVVIEAVSSDGSCTITLTKNGQQVSNTVGIQSSASSSTCVDLSVPMAQLSTGTWNITIDITSSSKQAHLTDSVTLE